MIVHLNLTACLRIAMINLRFGIELISSYDASLVFTLRAMFVRLICANGMTAI